MKVQENTQHQEKQKKEPEEHDERFATGGYFCNEVDFFVIVIYFAFIQNALIFGTSPIAILSVVQNRMDKPSQKLQRFIPIQNSADKI